MFEVSESRRYLVPATRLWDVVGDFHAMAYWHPAVVGSEPVDNGTVRVISLRDGGQTVEKLLDHDSVGRRYSYRVLDSPLPLTNYECTIRVEAEGEGGRLTWSGRFDAPADQGLELSDVVRGIYRAGLDHVGTML